MTADTLFLRHKFVTIEFSLCKYGTHWSFAAVNFSSLHFAGVEPSTPWRHSRMFPPGTVTPFIPGKRGIFAKNSCWPVLTGNFILPSLLLLRNHFFPTPDVTFYAFLPLSPLRCWFVVFWILFLLGFYSFSSFITIKFVFMYININSTGIS